MVIGELLEALFFRKIDEITKKYKEFDRLYYPKDPENYKKAWDQYIRESIKTKENLLEIVEDYNRNGKPIWQQEANQWCDKISSHKLNSALRNNSKERGKEIFELAERMREKWAFHLDEYASLVNSQDELVILELATGAGLGTWAVMKSLQEKSKMISTDVDFGCAKNADGLAKYLGCEDKACGLNANFWSLPVEDGIVDVVCTHYGIDESGEMQQTLSEISRVLKPNGKFIGVCRKRPYIRQQSIFEMFDIREEEANGLLCKLRLYSGIEDLEKLAQTYGLQLEHCKVFTPETGHERILFTFVKA
ncbi:MAG: class I SAM-dependent methyltransferase [Cellulosilyticaceae bacterium]